jgi:hypothetical protein
VRAAHRGCHGRRVRHVASHHLCAGRQALAVRVRVAHDSANLVPQRSAALHGREARAAARAEHNHQRHAACS